MKGHGYTPWTNAELVKILAAQVEKNRPSLSACGRRGRMHSAPTACQRASLYAPCSRFSSAWILSRSSFAGLSLSASCSSLIAYQLVAFLRVRHAQVKAERGVVGRLVHQRLEDLDGVVAEVLLQVDPAQRVGHLGRVRQQLLGLGRLGEGVVQVAVVLAIRNARLLSTMAFAGVQLERGFGRSAGPRSSGPRGPA